MSNIILLVFGLTVLITFLLGCFYTVHEFKELSDQRNTKFHDEDTKVADKENP